MGLSTARIVVAALTVLCGPSTSQWLRTGDPLIDTVIALEDPAGPCATIESTTTVYKPSPRGVPPVLEAKWIEDPNAQSAAARIAVKGPIVHSEGEVPNEKEVSAASPVPSDDIAPVEPARTFGTIQGEMCVMHLNAPAYSGDFAFVTFSNPGGQIGAYVFRKKAEGWRVVERVLRGYW